MTVLSVLRWLPGKQPVPPARTYVRDEREAPRFSVSRRVSIGPPGQCSTTGTMVNLSATGAAIRIDGPDADIRPPWFNHLTHGDEMWLAGLLGTSLLCWVVTFDDGVLRVHFYRDVALQDQLRGVIGQLAAERRDRGEAAAAACG